MSVVARAPDGTIRLYCKGADNIMIPRLRAGVDPGLLSSTQEHLRAYSVQVRLLHPCFAEHMSQASQVYLLLTLQQSGKQIFLQEPQPKPLLTLVSVHLAMSMVEAAP